MHSTNLFIPTKATEHEMHPVPTWHCISETKVFMGLIRKPSHSVWKQEGGEKRKEGPAGKAMLPSKCQENIFDLCCKKISLDKMWKKNFLNYIYSLTHILVCTGQILWVSSVSVSFCIIVLHQLTHKATCTPISLLFIITKCLCWEKILLI